MKYFVIGDEDTVLGFGLVGVKGFAVKNQTEAENSLKEALKDAEIGIIIITEKVAEWIRPQVDAYLFTYNFPLIVEIQDRGGRMAGKSGIHQMVNEAIGVKL
ncbi:V-type ATP synthase subunit F [candidate division KSB1 bacterium]|nr:V-type ATP synthase subunit F [candidate division KSB1 bacterium]RQW09645.1 MAG: Vacuolar H+transporting two-sector ATPase F subunit [candidate division KSB1 bacterium]